MAAGLAALLIGLPAAAVGATGTELDRTRALEPTADGAAAAARVLAGYAHQDQGEAGFGWWLRLPLSVRSYLSSQPTVRLWRNRLELMRDAERGDANACALSGPAVLDLPLLGCDYPREFDRYRRCLRGLPEARVQTLLRARHEADRALVQTLETRCDAATQAALAGVRAQLDADPP